MLDKINRLFKRKYFLFLLITAAAFSVFGEMYHHFILSNIRVMKISLNYPGAEQGLNPDGSRFNISEIANSEVIDEAKQGLLMQDLSYEDIKKRVFVTTKFSQTKMDEVTSDARSGLRSSYIPTTFYVYYSQKDKLAKNETYEFLESLAKTYQKHFYAKHAENNSLLKYTPSKEDFTGYDYSEIYTILSDRADEMLNLISDHMEENRGFRSQDNLNFGTVRDELANFKDVKLEKFNAFVVQNNISKNRPVFINKLSYLIDKNTITYNKRILASEISKDALYKYESRITAVAFVPSVDSSSSYYMSRTKTGIDDLATQSYNDGMDAKRVSKKLDEYDNRLKKLKKAKNSNNEVLEITDQYLSELLTDIDALSEKISALDDEYLNYKTKDYVSYELAEKSRVINIKIMIKFALLGGILALMLIAYAEFLHGIVHKKTKCATKALKIMTKGKDNE